MAQVPNYAATPKVGVAVISTANTNRDGTGTIGTIITAATSGTRLDRVFIQATGTTTAGMVRLFVHDGTNARLWEEIPVSAITPSGTTPAFSFTIPIEGGLILPNGFSLRASTNNAETFNIIAQGADF